MRRSWLVAAIVVGLGAIVIAVVAMRLTSDDESPATGWADAVCTSLADWRSSIVALTDVSGGLTADSLQAKLDDAQTANEELVTELRELGPPDVEAGDELDLRLDATADGIEDQYEELRSDAQQAIDSASSPAELFQSLATLAPQFQLLLGAVSNAVDELRGANLDTDARAELEQAFADAESCQELSGGQG